MGKVIGVLVASIFLTGCQSFGLKDMSAAQIKAMEGMYTCSTGKGHNLGTGAIDITNITANADDVRKGMSQKGTVSIKCGGSELTITNDSDARVPLVSPTGTVTNTTITTTTVPRGDKPLPPPNFTPVQ